MKKEFVNGRHYKLWLLNQLYPPYWDEGIWPHKSKGRKRRKREIYSLEYRASRTWKHTRLTQFKKT